MRFRAWGDISCFQNSEKYQHCVCPPLAWMKAGHHCLTNWTNVPSPSRSCLPLLVKKLVQLIDINCWVGGGLWALSHSHMFIGIQRNRPVSPWGWLAAAAESNDDPGPVQSGDVVLKNGAWSNDLTVSEAVKCYLCTPRRQTALHEVEGFWSPPPSHSTPWLIHHHSDQAPPQWGCGNALLTVARREFGHRGQT